ncbi:MAG: DUF1648 domain-containing protein, partial [Sphaerochaeta sp.]|nr:DUF1648 domain-containing protein [Sphaerochaeta sp.]
MHRYLRRSCSGARSLLEGPMKTKTKLIDRTLVLTTLVCILPILFSLSVYDRLPDQVPIHFDASGNPDNYAHKA